MSREQLQEGFNGFMGLLKLKEGLDLKKVKTGIGFGIQFYSISLTNTVDEIFP